MCDASGSTSTVCPDAAVVAKVADTARIAAHQGLPRRRTISPSLVAAAAPRSLTSGNRFDGDHWRVQKSEFPPIEQCRNNGFTSAD